MSSLDNSGNKQLTTQERDQIPVNNPALDGIIIFHKNLNRLERLRNRTWHPLIGDTGSFVGLSDTPGVIGSVGSALRVNASQTGLEYFDPTAGTNTHTEQIGNSSDTIFTITHPLNTKFVQVAILETLPEVLRPLILVTLIQPLNILEALVADDISTIGGTTKLVHPLNTLKHL